MDSHSIRKKLRLSSYNYFQTNRYFITICTHNKECIFGVVGGQTVQLSPLGLLVEQEWLHLTERFPNIDVVPFIVMPNHIHAVVTINHCSQHPLQAIALHPKKGQRYEMEKGRASSAPTKTARNASLFNIVQTYKSITTVTANKLDHTPGRKIWQRNYYEHIIRNEEDFLQITSYIQGNVSKWNGTP
jgi:REP element-mobilizing transposase RayT